MFELTERLNIFNAIFKLDVNKGFERALQEFAIRSQDTKPHELSKYVSEIIKLISNHYNDLETTNQERFQNICSGLLGIKEQSHKETE